MRFRFTITEDGKIEYEEAKKIIREKGKSLVRIPDDFTVIDLETTGLDPRYDDIIEIAALKVRNMQVIDKFESLVKPKRYYTNDDGSIYYVDDFITELTGITNDMLENAPLLENVLSQFLMFIKDDIALGHNVNFDINFLYDSLLEELDYKFNNNFVDLMRLSRKVYPQFKNHKLRTIAEQLNVNTRNLHRGLTDCFITYDCIIHLSQHLVDKNLSLDSLFSYKKKDLNLKDINTNKSDFDMDHPLYGKYCVFTGKLEKMIRKEAAQKVVDLGGLCENSVTKNTNYLILGNFDYCNNIKGDKSSKLKKAEKLILGGQDLQILSENVFEDLIIEH